MDKNGDRIKTKILMQANQLLITVSDNGDKETYRLDVIGLITHSVRFFLISFVTTYNDSNVIF